MSQKPDRTTEATGSIPEPVTWNVVGMSCGHCVAAVTDEVSGVQGVTAVAVDLAAGTVTVAGGDPALIVAAIDEAGYELA